MRIPIALTLGVLLVGAAQPRAEQPSAAGGLRLVPQGAARGNGPSGKSNPYSRLFEVEGFPTPPRVSRARPPVPVPMAARSIESPSIKCGMKLIPGDPSIDPGIVVPTDKHATKSHVRGVEPGTCW